jgi:hypothetical protein
METVLPEQQAQPAQPTNSDSEAQITESGELVAPSVKQDRPNNQNQNSLSTIETDLTSTSGIKPRKASGGSGSSSSSKSSGSTSGSSSSNDQEGTSESVAYFETTQPVIYSSPSPESLDASISESKTIQGSSPSITKMKDVIQAKQEDLSNIDPSQCRASANGKCLMK